MSALGPARPLKGILLVVLATLAFASADVLTKRLTADHPIPVVIAVRYLVNLGLLGLFLYPRIGAQLWRVQNPGLVFQRGFCLALASLTMGLALRLMPVGEIVAIVYLSPFAVMVLAIPLLGGLGRGDLWLYAGCNQPVRHGAGLGLWRCQCGAGAQRLGL